jgi:hypothetical protein
MNPSSFPFHLSSALTSITTNGIRNIFLSSLLAFTTFANCPSAKAGLQDEVNNQNAIQTMDEQCRKKLESQSSFHTDPYDHFRIQGDDIYRVYLYGNNCNKQWEKYGIIGQTINVDYNTAYKAWNQVAFYRENGRICKYLKEYGDPARKDSCYDYKQW